MVLKAIAGWRMLRDFAALVPAVGEMTAAAGAVPATRFRDSGAQQSADGRGGSFFHAGACLGLCLGGALKGGRVPPA